MFQYYYITLQQDWRRTSKVATYEGIKQAIHSISPLKSGWYISALLQQGVYHSQSIFIYFRSGIHLEFLKLPESGFHFKGISRQKFRLEKSGSLIVTLRSQKGSSGSRMGLRWTRTQQRGSTTKSEFISLRKNTTTTVLHAELFAISARIQKNIRTRYVSQHTQICTYI